MNRAGLVGALLLLGGAVAAPPAAVGATEKWRFAGLTPTAFVGAGGVLVNNPLNGTFRARGTN